MTLTLTRKIFLGYFLIICLVLMEGAYAVFELNRLNQLSRSMVHGEVVSMDLEKKLIDLFLTQVSNEKKYLVVQDQDFLDLALTQSEEFDQTLLRLIAGEPDGPLREDLDEIQQRHDRHLQGFLSAIPKEPDPFGEGEIDSSEWSMNVETEVRSITRRIEDLVRKEEMEMARKMSQAQEFSLRAYKITIVIVVSMGFLGLIMALLMTRSVREPIKRLKQGTRYVADGIFDNRIQISSRDEFGDLARAFNSMTQRLGELEEMKREFISNVSHELRTPLTSIKAATALMLDEVPGSVTLKQKRLLGIIQEETVKLVRLINNLLDLSRIRAGMMQYHFERGDIRSILNVGLSNFRFLSELKKIDLKIDLEESLPDILMDKEKIEQVVNNLLSNAMKFTHEGGRITIHAARSASKIEGDTLSSGREGVIRVCIEDTGIGIDPEALTGIFERFRQADPIFGKPVKGTGLGLSICKYYVEEHGGRIWAESEKGMGSRFYFDLPFISTEEKVTA